MWRFTALAVLAAYFIWGADSDAALAGMAAALSSHNEQQARNWERRLLAGDANEDTLLQAGALLAQRDMLADAAALFERCAQRFPASFEARYNLALTRIGLRDYPAAEGLLRSISPATSREIAAWQYLQGKLYFATNRLAEARQSLENAYRGNPAAENYALDLALLYIRSSAYVPAIQILQPSLTRHPESAELAIELALADALSRRQPDALAVCRKLLEKDPRLATARVIAAFANCSAANYRGCETEAAAGLALPESNPYLHYLYAEALWNSGSSDRRKILRELDTAIAKLPDCGVCFLLRSRVYEAAQNDRAAIADVKAALEQEPNSAQAWYRLATLYRKSGEASAAADALRQYRGIQEQQSSGEIESFRKQFLGSEDNKPDQ